MQPAPLPANETARLEALRQRAILDTPPEAAFDDLTTLAAHICEAPMAMITLVDEDRQWFKSCVGCPLVETRRDIAFCSHTILQPEVWVVPDALADDRFADNPLVTSKPHIRFYAGAPLVTPDGHALGALCVMDRQPRKLTEEQGQALRVLAHHVVTMLELRRSLQEQLRAEAERDRAQAALYVANEALERRVQERTGELESQRAYLNELFENTPEAIVLLDTEHRVVRVNGEFTRLFGYTIDEARGRNIHDFLVPDELKTEAEAYRRQIQHGERVVAESVRLRKDGSRLDVAILGVPITISGGQLERYAIYQDITERKRAERAVQQENVYLHEVLRSASQFGDVIGESAALQRVLANVEQVAGTDSTVLITGETGTGKEIIAQTIHRLSPRRDRVLVTVNCAALPASLIESELFGHEKGAFTGAQTRTIGRFELADKGTLFLDEIGDLPLELQAKLLRVLQAGEFQRVGGTATLRADVRVIGATNRDLEKAVQEGTFRADLYYRLNVFPIALPPLRERPGDIALLVRHFVQKFSQKLGKKIEAVSQATLDALAAYPWPGNVRELENVIERAVIVSQGPTLELGEWLPKPKASPGEGPFLTLAETERQHILQALETTGWRVSGPRGAAVLLGLKPTTLEARMKKLGITRQ